jgi:hypothetical protein
VEGVVDRQIASSDVVKLALDIFDDIVQTDWDVCRLDVLNDCLFDLTVLLVGVE